MKKIKKFFNKHFDMCLILFLVKCVQFVGYLYVYLAKRLDVQIVTPQMLDLTKLSEHTNPNVKIISVKDLKIQNNWLKN